MTTESRPETYEEVVAATTTTMSRRDFLWLAAGAACAATLAGCQLGTTETHGQYPVTPVGSTPNRSELPTSPSLLTPTPTYPETTVALPSTTPVAPPSSIEITLSPTSPTPSGSLIITDRPTGPLPPAARNLPPDYYILSGPSDKPYIALSVDDFSGSAAPDYLDGSLRIARQKGVKYTFFPIGQALALADSPYTRRLWGQARDDGHIIGNHTWDHDESLAKGSAKHIESELSRQLQIVQRFVGKDYIEFLMRPPGGSGGYHVIDPQTKYQKQLEKEFQYTRGIVQQFGYWLTMWGIDSNDSKNRMVTPGDTVKQQDDRFLRKIFYGDPQTGAERVQNGSIILVHPTTLSLDGMARLIDGLHARGYDCVSIPELFAKS